MTDDFLNETICTNCELYKDNKCLHNNKPIKNPNLEVQCSNFKSQDKILELLEQEFISKYYLDLGYSDEYNVFWYGFNLNGREAVILSDGRILRNTEEKIKDKTIGKNEVKKIFDYNGYIGDIAPTISNETIKKFYIKKERNHLIDPKEIYKTVRDKILYYMDFSGKDEIADVLTCWIIATYLYPLFYWFPHILINAPSQSGKSKCLIIIIFLSFRGFDLGASAGVTPAQIFRTIEGNRGTIIIDEYEQIDNETQKLVNQILNASASKDAYIIRTEQIDKKWKAWKFPIFCPKAIGNISGINPVSLSRVIAFKWLKTTGEKGKRKPEREKDKKSFVPIRESLYLFGLENWQEIKKIYDDLDIPELKNREEDNWLPLFAIAHFIDSCEGDDVNAETQLIKYLKDYKDVEVETEDNTETFFELLYENVAEESQYYTPKEIGGINAIADLLNYLKSPPHWIGKKLKLFQFKQFKISGARKYLLSKNSVKKIIDTYYTNIMLPNDPNVTKCNERNLMLLKQKTLDDIRGIIPENREVIKEEQVEDRPLNFTKIDQIHTTCSGCKKFLICEWESQDDSKELFFCDPCKNELEKIQGENIQL